MTNLHIALEQQQSEPVHGDIRALKYRIHELEGEVIGYKRMLDVAEAAPPQQQAEPIGWLDGNDKLAEFMHRDLKADHDKRGSATPREFTVPVYTAPPQRKPLTGEEITNIVREVSKGSALRPMNAEPTSVRIARAIEAAHGIKEPKS